MVAIAACALARLVGVDFEEVRLVKVRQVMGILLIFAACMMLPAPPLWGSQ